MEAHDLAEFLQENNLACISYNQLSIIVVKSHTMNWLFALFEFSPITIFVK